MDTDPSMTIFRVILINDPLLVLEYTIKEVSDLHLSLMVPAVHEINLFMVHAEIAPEIPFKIHDEHHPFLHNDAWEIS